MIFDLYVSLTSVMVVLKLFSLISMGWASVFAIPVLIAILTFAGLWATDNLRMSCARYIK